MNEIERLRQIIRDSDRIVFFGGAGVSTESNIPDFRSQDGLYNQKNQYPWPPEVMLSRSFFDSHPREFYQFYFDRMIALDAVPNPAHKALAQLEQEGKLSAVITQNIDGLHQKAGSVNVLELHGSVLRNYCMECGKFYGLEDVLKLRDKDGIPRCELDQSVIKPDVVLYEEGLDQTVLAKAIHEISRCDTLIVGGTSLVVYPAAGLLQYFRGRHLVLINRDATPYDDRADLVIRDSIGKALSEAVAS
ncbi:NAD-dependent protein deacylase [uncultured Faecalibaculum sp.]|uniref:NAD-dependent protein deacylase n=1 Tax=uncultured Faecalibaculum sp. TaxID=1729681 RepID=UPI002633E13D|nr:NAD-dependent protein deacylase [uncultured Faecalibaculum sp.]